MFHFGSPVNDWPRAVAQLPAGYVIKAIDNVQMLAEAKAVNPGVKTDLRHWYDPGQVFGGNDAENRNRARQFFDTFIDGTFMDYAHAVDYVEEFNEYNANSHNADEIADRVRWTEAVAWVWHYEYRTRPGLEHIQLILCNTAIGNDIHVGQAATAMTYNCLLGYHPYWPVKNNYTPDEEWEWYSGRWTAMDYKFLSLGVLVEWAFTEAGAVRYWNDWPNIGLDPMGGWKHPECHNSNLVEYKNGIARWMNKWQDWNTLHGDRALPPVLFDSRPGHTEWDNFQIQQPEMDEIAQLAQQWQPGNPAPPPPPPPPVGIDPELHRHLWQVSLDNQVLRLNPDAALQKRINREGYQIVGNEAYTNWEGSDYAVQGAEHLEGEPRHISYARVGDWDNVLWLGKPATGISNPSNHDIIDISLSLPKHPVNTYSTRPLSAIETLTIHHTVSPSDRPIESIAQYHVDKGWPGIGYHYVIKDDGTIYQTNALETISYHSGGNNGYSVGIALQGDFTNVPPSDAQLESARWLVNELTNDLQVIDVRPHRRMQGAATQCPGNTWEDWFHILTD